MHRLLDPYRPLFRTPGTVPLFALAFWARIPSTAKGMLLTLYVVFGQHRGYSAAGLAATALTAGLAAGGPLLGRAADRYGARPVLAATAAAESAFWLAAPFLPYPALVPAALAGGLASVPVTALVRQAVAVRVPAPLQRQAFALDSMALEAAYMAGPALAVLAVAGLHQARPAMLAAALLTLAGAAALRPLAAGPAPARPAGAAAPAGPGRRPLWRHPGMLSALALCAAANLVLSGTEVSVVAALRAAGQAQWAGAAIGAWCAASLAGGFWHGTAARPPRMPVLVLLLGLATIPVGAVAAHGWAPAALALAPAGFLCAPALASAAEAVSRAAPLAAKGQAMGLQGAALTLGSTLGTPLTGALIDHTAPACGFAAAGLAGALAAATALALRTAHPTATATAGSTAPASAPPHPGVRPAPDAPPAAPAAPPALPRPRPQAPVR